MEEKENGKDYLGKVSPLHKNLNKELSYNTAILLLGIYTQEMKMFTQKFIHKC